VPEERRSRVYGLQRALMGDRPDLIFNEGKKATMKSFDAKKKYSDAEGAREAALRRARQRPHAVPGRRVLIFFLMMCCVGLSLLVLEYFI
jgi:hypothetical protein